MKIKSYLILIFCMLFSCSGEQGNSNTVNGSSNGSIGSASFGLDSDLQIRSFRKIYNFYISVTEVNLNSPNDQMIVRRYYNRISSMALPKGGEITQYTPDVYAALIKFSSYVCNIAYDRKTEFYGFDFSLSVNSLSLQLEEIAGEMTSRVFGESNEEARIETQDILVETMNLSLSELGAISESEDKVKKATLVSACSLLLSSPAAIFH